MELSRNGDISTMIVSSSPVPGNQTDFIIAEEGQVEVLSIIVWCVGGVLLITLFSLLGRIILAKKKYPFDNLDTLREAFQRNGNVFRIRIDAPEYVHRSTTLSRDTVDLVPGSDVAITDSPGSRRSEAGHQNCGTSYRQMEHRTYDSSLSNSSAIPHNQSISRSNAHQTFVEQPRVHSSSSPTSSSQIITSNLSQSCAMLNGYVISPPPYRDVVTANNRLPSVVIAREHRTLPHNQRRQLFAL